MKIGIQTWGSEGDIRPFIALAGGLSRRGHNVTLAYTSVSDTDYSSLADTLNFSSVSVNKNFEYTRELKDKLVRCVLKERIPVRQLTVILDELFEPAVDNMYNASIKLCRDNDVVIAHWIVHPVSAAAEKTGRPYIAVILNHSGIPSRNKTPIGLPKLGKWANPFWWWLVKKIINKMFMPDVAFFRVREGLPPAHDVITDIWESKTLNIIAVSPSFCGHQADWGDSYKISGFLNLPETADDWQIPPELSAFLDSGEPPVYMTFGSLMPVDPEVQKEVIVLMTEAVKLSKCRAIIQSSLDDFSDLPVRPEIYYTDKVPHSRIFPLCSAVIHHGGAGTTQSATLAGCPSIVVAHITDQMFWGAELNRLGAAPVPLHARSFNAKKLANKIRAVMSSPHMRQNAVRIGNAMKNEEGIRKAVELIEERIKKI